MTDATDHYVQFKNVQKSYDGETLVVKDLNLDVQRGEFMTMLGPSGSGKTTCLMMLSGFETATHGEIYLDGQPIMKMQSEKLVEKIMSKLAIDAGLQVKQSRSLKDEQFSGLSDEQLLQQVQAMLRKLGMKAVPVDTPTGPPDLEVVG